MTARAPEANESLWVLAAPAALWAAHFLVTYATAAIWCAKVSGRGGPVEPLRVLIGLYTLIALAAIVRLGWGGYRRQRLGGPAQTQQVGRDSAEDRHRFLGLTTMLMSGLSAVAVLLAALAAALVGSCQ